MGIKLKIYQIMVNRVPGIRYRYIIRRNRANSFGKRIGCVMYLGGLNIMYHVFRMKSIGNNPKLNPDDKKKLIYKCNESDIYKRETPEKLAAQLEKYDIISFDMFDTLIFRPFDRPVDLFYEMSAQLSYMDFSTIRVRMETEARFEKFRKHGTYEITLEDIYKMLQDRFDFPTEIMQLEIELEKEFCYANPYMKKVFELLKIKGKRIIITSDMYLRKEILRDILRINGYEPDEIYVSCEYDKSKNKGDLYDYIRDTEGRNKKIAHVGDNYDSDILVAKKHGISSFYYKNVNELGNRYRAEDMSVIAGGAYRGTVNAKLHNGLESFSRFYEFGYAYGGIFVVGYCRFIHEYAMKNNCNRIIFLARDGYILKKAYEMMYPEHSEQCRYMYWSRLAATKLASGHYKYDYFRRFLYHKLNQGYTLKDIFHTMEIDFLLEKSDLNYNTELTDMNVMKIEGFLNEHWTEIQESYEVQQLAARQYAESLIGDSRKALAVDIGWAGSGAIALDYLVNNKWGLNCEITGVIAGTNSFHTVDSDGNEALRNQGKIVSYMYSQSENRDIFKIHDPNRDHNLYWEMLLDAPHGSLKGFSFDENKDICFEFKDSSDDTDIKELQNGILDFVADYMHSFIKHDIFMNISGRDAYAPMLIAISKQNTRFWEELDRHKDDANLC